MENFIQSSLKEAGLPDLQFGSIVLTVCESVNNAISHGNGYDINKTVDIRLLCEKSELSIEIQDQGNGFNIHEIPDPTESCNIKNERGRGIFIIRNLADEVKFENNGSLIIIKFKLSREHQFLL